MRGKDAEGNSLPLQGDGERTLQVSRRVIDRAEDGGRKEEVGGEPAVMVKEAYIFERSARARHGVSSQVRAGMCARGMRFAEQYARARVMGFDGVGNTLRERYADGGFTAVKAEAAPESYGQVDGVLARIGKPCKLRR